jgi:hypothetical protein
MRGIRVVTDTLPGRAICSATIVDGVLWLVLDLDKPSAPRHALGHDPEAARSEAALEAAAAPLTAVRVVPLALVS